MYEFIHAVEHVLGFCGEKHMTLLSIFLENPRISTTFTYIANYIKFLQTKL